ncbi:MAG: glycine cleavage system protein GcvH [Fimbriimonadia bacterium]|nr:glycine cleavage system protein GcvH [Fimbriimonadia bacterium]
MNVPSDLRYTRSDEWVRLEGNEAVIGITDYAQSELGDIVYLDLPEAGRYVQPEEPFGVIESVKAASDLYAPVEGEVLAANSDLQSALETINQDPYGAGWFLRIQLKDPAQVNSLLTAEQYKEYRNL